MLSCGPSNSVETQSSFVDVSCCGLTKYRLWHNVQTLVSPSSRAAPAPCALLPSLLFTVAINLVFIVVLLQDNLP